MRKLTLLALMLALLSCKESDPVRAMVDEIADAAEDRDVDDVMKHVAATYPGRAEVQQTLRQYFFGYSALNISITNYKAEVGSTTGAATFEVNMTGVPKQIGGLDQLLPRTARYRFDVQLVKEGNDWKVESAEYQPL